MKRLQRAGILGALVLFAAGCGTSSGSSASSGSSGSSSSGSSSANSGGPNSAQFQKYTKCLAQHGVNLPTPPSGGAGAPGAGYGPPSGNFGGGYGPPAGGYGPSNGGSLPSGVTPPTGGTAGGFPGLDQSDPTVQKAMQACASLQPQFPNGGLAPGANGAPSGSGSSSASATTTGQTN